MLGLTYEVLDPVLRLLSATLLGALVGLQRERSHRPAGLRTHAVVALGAALITLVSASYPGDHARIAAQIVSGIGFLGAGTIIREGRSVRGLTTAATLWAVAGIGMACARGGEITVLAVVTTILVLFILSMGKILEEHIEAANGRVMRVILDPASAVRVTHALTLAGANPTVISRTPEGDREHLLIRVHHFPSRIFRSVTAVPGVHHVEWEPGEEEQDVP